MEKSNKRNEAEVDFEKNPTSLYLLIQNKEWEGVKVQAKNYDEEARVFVYRCDENGILKWRLLPIHCALLHDAPSDVLKAILNAYKAGAKAQDDHGMLPLHIAIKKHAPPETINLLLAAYPKSVDVPNSKGFTPYKMAEATSSPHKEYYLRALKKGSSTYKAITASFSDLFCGVNFPELSGDPKTGFGLLAH